MDELLRELVEAIRYGDYLQAEARSARDRMENVRELIDGAAETVVDEGGEVGLTPLDHFLQRAMLVAGIDTLDPDADAVTLMTLHNAKGLEFPVVFITGLEDGLFPLSQAFDDPPMLEEERRLFYVGITRAERKLYLSHAESAGETASSCRRIHRASSRHSRGDARGAKTIKVRSSGRSMSCAPVAAPAAMRARPPSARGRRAPRGDASPTPCVAASAGHAGSSIARRRGEDESQDAAVHARASESSTASSAAGAIAELTGSGRDAKVKIDFDDEDVGRKTLELAHAKLERGRRLWPSHIDDVRHIAELARLGSATSALRPRRRAEHDSRAHGSAVAGRHRQQSSRRRCRRRRHSASRGRRPPIPLARRSRRSRRPCATGSSRCPASRRTTIPRHA